MKNTREFLTQSSFQLQMSKDIQPLRLTDFRTALVILPPSAEQDTIQAIRRVLDKSHVDLWPAHISLVYPCVEKEHLEEAAARLQTTLRDTKQFTLHLNEFKHFDQRKKGFVTWLSPEPATAVQSVRATAVKALTGVAGQLGKQPHLTVARGHSTSQAPTLQTDWKPMQFHCGSLALLVRENNKTPMRVFRVIPFQ